MALISLDKVNHAAETQSIEATGIAIQNMTRRLLMLLMIRSSIFSLVFIINPKEY